MPKAGAITGKNGMGDRMKREDYIQKILQNYQLVTVLSSKNGGKVLHLRNKNLQKDLVLRSYPQAIEAYRKLLNVRTSALPEVYDVTDWEDGQIVLEEFISGLTVAQVMETGKYRPTGVKRVMKALCRGMSVLHELEIIHRDIKPENLMITPNGRVALIDLNASRHLSAANKDTVIMGTVGYASPEQLGITQSDARTDIYAAGVLLNVMLTGVHPSQKLASGHYGRIIRKCTAINPDDRFQSAKNLEKALW